MIHEKERLPHFLFSRIEKLDYVEECFFDDGYLCVQYSVAATWDIQIKVFHELLSMWIFVVGRKSFNPHKYKLAYHYQIEE